MNALQYQSVINKYGQNATVWLITFRDDEGWQQIIYVIAKDRRFAVSVARTLTIFDRPQLKSAITCALNELQPGEVEMFIGPKGQPQNIAVFDAEVEDEE